MGSKIFDGKLDVVAREIRTPAGVTWSALEELAYELSQRKECNDAKLTEVLGMAKLGVQRLLNLSDRLALMNELDNAPSFELQRYHVDLREVVEESLGRATYLAARKAIKASSSFGDRACIVHVDARWLGAVVLEGMAGKFKFARFLCDGAQVNISELAPLWNDPVKSTDFFINLGTYRLPDELDTVVELEYAE